jgi:predicted HNH restriction endonuclease
MNNYSLKRFIFLFLNFNYCCYFCKSEKNLECHHIVIQNTLRGRGSFNRLNDLMHNYNTIMLLCSNCHKNIHRFYEVI